MITFKDGGWVLNGGANGLEHSGGSREGRGDQLFREFTLEKGCGGREILEMGKTPQFSRRLASRHAKQRAEWGTTSGRARRTFHL